MSEDEAMDDSPSSDESLVDEIWTQREEAAKLHIEEIRTQVFHIGSERAKALEVGLHRALVDLPKDVNFLKALILNAEENEYEKDVEPQLRFVMTEKDITATGAPATLLVFNNEVGFSKENMECICSIFQTTKKGKRQQQTGNGFKSVFLVSSQPYIFSNGYRVRFQEEPDQDCGVGYIVPQWVSGHPSLSSISDEYRLGSGIPATTIILPLKPSMVNFVREQLSQLCPEILLFLSNLKRLYVRYSEPKADNTVLSFRKEVDNSVVHLFKKKMDDSEESCHYYLRVHKCPIRVPDRFHSPVDLQNSVIIFAFPLRERMRTATSSVGIFAFLPTKMVTGFPFIIHADFILNSSQDSLMDNKWNMGIFSQIPSAFADAIQGLQNHPLRGPAQKIFDFLPVQASSILEFDILRELIRTQLQVIEIVPCGIGGDVFYKRPQEVVCVRLGFRCLIDKFRSKGYHILSRTSKSLPLLSYLDNDRNNAVLEYVGVKHADDHWYTKCIQRLCSSIVEKDAKGGIMTLLQLIEYLSSTSLDDPFLMLLKKIIAKSKCLTAWGNVCQCYRTPEECILFDAHWNDIVQWNQIPSIDQDFYGRQIHKYKNQLRDIGVKVDPLSVCSLLSRTLSKWVDDLHEGFERPGWDIVKIYKFMSNFQWRPEVPPALIFTNNVDRDWVPANMCVFHGEEHLFGSRKYVLDHHYKDEFLPLFCDGFGVNEKPSIQEYLDLLEGRKGQVDLEEFYCSFWKSIVDKWNPDIQETLREKLTQVPARKPRSKEIYLIKRTEAFLADDMYLEKLFSSYDEAPLFVWCPTSDCVSKIRLQEIYESLGVRKISESVERIEKESGGAGEATPINGLIGRGLIKIVLGFLAGRQVYMPLKGRQTAASSLLQLRTYRIQPPYELVCRLQRSESDSVEVKEVKLVYWKERSELFIDSSRYDNIKSDPELIAAFADELSQGLLPQAKHYAAREILSLVMQLGFLIGFNEDKVEDMLIRENLQLSEEDREFVDANLSPSIEHSPAARKRSSMERDQAGPSASTSSGKKQRQIMD